MDKVAIRISGARSFFEEVTAEAARLDRSPSWLLGHCLGTTLPKLSGLVAHEPRAPEGRSAIVAVPTPKAKAKAKANVKTDRHEWTFFVPRTLVEHCGRLAARLGMSSDDVLAYAWQAGRDGVRAMPSS